jgi:DnaJ-class molecular chaperone
MVRKETCSHCKGNRHVRVVKTDGKDSWVKCPSCGGQGYKVRLER